MSWVVMSDINFLQMSNMHILSTHLISDTDINWYQYSGAVGAWWLKKWSAACWLRWWVKQWSSLFSAMLPHPLMGQNLTCCSFLLLLLDLTGSQRSSSSSSSIAVVWKQPHDRRNGIPLSIRASFSSAEDTGLWYSQIHPPWPLCQPTLAGSGDPVLADH